MMAARILALTTTTGAATPDPVTVLVQSCDRCGARFEGLTSEAGHTRCQECRDGPAVGDVVIGIDHGDDPVSVVTMTMRRTETGYTVESISRCKPIDFDCFACGAEPGNGCNCRTMGRRWLYHRARVDAAGGGR